MTEVEKVSIGGYAFTLEVEAYAIVKQYLDELASHYGPLEGGAEVMEGFEERMAELLYEKCADDGVASVAEVQEIIGVLGRPSAIESESDPDPKSEAAMAAGAKNGRGQKKKLYRDPSGKVLGGVCSGLAAYFKIDVVLVRIIFCALVIMGIAIDSLENMTPLVLLAYAALWIAMPEAKTVQQRWEMGVSNPPAGGKPAGSEVGKILRIVIGVLLIITAVAGLTGGFAAIFGQKFFGLSFLQEAWEDVSDNAPEIFSVASSLTYKIVAAIALFLPFVGMLYGGVVMVFDVKSPSWRPGLVIFIVWIVALTALTVLTLMGMFHFGFFS